MHEWWWFCMSCFCGCSIACVFVQCVLVYSLPLVTISFLQLDHLVAYVLMGVKIEVNKNTNYYLQRIAVTFLIFNRIIFQRHGFQP